MVLKDGLSTREDVPEETSLGRPKKLITPPKSLEATRRNHGNRCKGVRTHAEQKRAN